ncbi:short chain dehydrogenase/reductase family oxidoreductase [Fictibacillus macauensis ZFHKF-1]|uniref:Short chain dehydrogenase/reductase family oxidoreductase n=1 Tax=Fictibacillus macauensis ZFHKF-1 TaxID=1196324 RepID=I8AMQ5_9BACL|nr:SDR family oxidoreductase [Fictibacillus macauensis]EIT87292.1 short chain dehydrogenase/reductase family oxidoreductase [Fictibacillus macauensis ZFHKF-1]
MKRLDGQVIVITGASSGLGAQLAFDAATLGAEVVLMARTGEKLVEVQERIAHATGKEPLLYTLDVANVEEVRAVFDALLQKVTPHVLINNAGFGVFDSFHEANLSDIQHMLQTNVMGTMACTQAVLGAMRQHGRGHIINIASQAGKLSTPKSTGYAASKHAVLGFTNGLRMELAGTGIAVTAVNPGPIATNFFATADPSGNYVNNVKRWMLTPQAVSKAVLGAISSRRREVNIPRLMGIGSTLYQLFPRLVETLGGKAFHQK